MDELWKTVDGFDNYQVSDTGKVKSLNYNHTGKEKCLKPKQRKNDGRLEVVLKQNGQTRYVQVHILVAEAFIPNPLNKPHVHHINNDFTDNSVENLMWVTPDEHMALHNEDGTRSKKISNKKTNGKTSKQVNQIDCDGNLLMVWPSLREIERSKGYLHGNVGAACHSGKMSYGYYWQYAS